MQPGIFLSICAASVLGLLYAEWRERPELRWIFKPLAALAFILTGASAGALETPFGRIIMLGLILCAIGDVLLIPKAKGAFLAGMAAFAAGHVAYIAAFFSGGIAVGPAVVLTSVLFTMFAAGFVSWLRRDLGAFFWPVSVYSLIIGAMVVASAAHLAAQPTQESAQLALAAAGFAISDISVARDRFKGAGFANRLWGLPLYFGSQCLFAIRV